MVCEAIKYIVYKWSFSPFFWCFCCVLLVLLELLATLPPFPVVLLRFIHIHKFSENVHKYGRNECRVRTGSVRIRICIQHKWALKGRFGTGEWCGNLSGIKYNSGDVAETVVRVDLSMNSKNRDCVKGNREEDYKWWHIRVMYRIYCNWSYGEEKMREIKTNIQWKETRLGRNSSLLYSSDRSHWCPWRHFFILLWTSIELECITVIPTYV